MTKAYLVAVTEHSHVIERVWYRVEADSEEGAKILAGRGDGEENDRKWLFTDEITDYPDEIEGVEEFDREEPENEIDHM